MVSKSLFHFFCFMSNLFKTDHLICLTVVLVGFVLSRVEIKIKNLTFWKFVAECFL